MLDKNNPFNLPESFEESFEHYHVPKQYKNWLVMSDLHFPYHNIRAITESLNYGIQKNIDAILINGDGMDCYQLSKFNPDPRKRNLKEEIDAYGEFLDIIRKIAPVTWKLGNHCFDDKTEILTTDGWKMGLDLSDEDVVGTLNTQTNIVEYQKPSEIIKRQHDGIMYSVQTNSFDFNVTDGHRMYYRDDSNLNYKFERIGDMSLTNGRRIWMKHGGVNNNPEHNISDDELKILAWIITDGSVVKKPDNRQPGYVIYQSKPQNIDRILGLLDSLKIRYSLTWRNKKVEEISGRKLLSQLPSAVIRLLREKNGTKYKDHLFLDFIIKDKYILPEIIKKLSSRQFDLFLDEIVLGNGSIPKHDDYNCNCSCLYGRKDIIEQFQVACLENGYRVSIYVYRGNQYRLNITHKDESCIDKSGTKIQTNQYNGMVWCAVVPNSTLITRRNGKVLITGNCERLEKMLISKAPELLGIEEFQLENLLRCGERNIQVVKDQRIIYIGHLPVLHGHEVHLAGVSVNPARSLFLKTKKSALCGHLHQTSQHCEMAIDDKMITTWSTGHLGETHPMYARINRWNHGIARIEVNDAGEFEVINLRIQGNKLFRS